jgi:hypothetical protein
MIVYLIKHSSRSRSSALRVNNNNNKKERHTHSEGIVPFRTSCMNRTPLVRRMQVATQPDVPSCLCNPFSRPVCHHVKYSGLLQ